MTRSATGRAALAYTTRLGWYVFPLRPASKEPHGRLVRHGHKDATRDPEQIRRWWSADPEAGVAWDRSHLALVVTTVPSAADEYGVAAAVGRPDGLLELLPKTQPGRRKMHANNRAANRIPIAPPPKRGRSLIAANNGIFMAMLPA